MFFKNTFKLCKRCQGVLDAGDALETEEGEILVPVEDVWDDDLDDPDYLSEDSDDLASTQIWSEPNSPTLTPSVMPETPSEQAPSL